MNNINLYFPLDYIILIIILLFVIFSTWKGFIQSVLGLMTWVGSIIITLYSYVSLSDYINYQLLKIEIFQSYEMISNFISIIISIPIIFLISLFILKRIRRVLSSDLDKQILGLLIDKLLGIIYGFIFSYFLLTTLIYLLNQFNFESTSIWFVNNSNILLNINNFNEEHIYNLIDDRI